MILIKFEMCTLDECCVVHIAHIIR